MGADLIKKNKNNNVVATYIVTSTRPSDRLRRDRHQKKRKEFKLTVSILAEKSRNRNGISIKKTHLQKRLGATTLGGKTGIDNEDGAHIGTLCPTNPSQIESESPARPNVSNRYNSKALGYGFTLCSWPSPGRVASGIVCPRPWSWPSSFSFCGPGWVFHSGRQAFGTLVWRRWNLALGERDRSDSSVVVVQSVSIVSAGSCPSHDCWFCSCPGSLSSTRISPDDAVVGSDLDISSSMRLSDGRKASDNGESARPLFWARSLIKPEWSFAVLVSCNWNNKRERNVCMIKGEEYIMGGELRKLKALDAKMSLSFGWEFNLNEMNICFRHARGARALWTKHQASRRFHHHRTSVEYSQFQL